MLNTALYSEEDLIVSLRKGDESAYLYLYEHYSATLYGCVIQIIPDRTLAEDTLQEVFLKIFQKIDLYDVEKGRLFTWMMQLTRNMAIDKVRSKSYKENQKVETLDVRETESRGQQSEMPSMDHLGMDKILFSLDEAHKKVIDLAYFQGYTQTEIARELDLPLGTVKTRVRNALVQIRKLLNIA